MTEKPVTIPPKIVRDTDYKVIFANYIRARMAPTDFGLTFGFNDEEPQGGKAAREAVQIVMTWSVVKTLMVSLQSTIALYEEANGEIPMSGPKPIQPEKIFAAMEDLKAKVTAEKDILQPDKGKLSQI